MNEVTDVDIDLAWQVAHLTHELQNADNRHEQDSALLAQMAEALAMALNNCIRCNGSGTVRPRGGPQPCALCFPERQALDAYRSAVGAP